MTLFSLLRGHCLMCHQSLRFSHHGICSICSALLPKVPCPCRYCGLPTTLDDECYRCRSQRPPWQHLIAVSPYEDPLKSWVHGVKFSRKTEWAFALSRLMVIRWLATRRQYGLSKPDWVIPVPLTHKKHWKRGYNQAALLAKPLAKLLQTHYSERQVLRRFGLLDQKILTAEQRKVNLMGAFHCQDVFHNKRLLLVDDVVTTGATIRAVCDALNRQKPKEIQVICVCRTL